MVLLIGIASALWTVYFSLTLFSGHLKLSNNIYVVLKLSSVFGRKQVVNVSSERKQKMFSFCFTVSYP